MRVTTAPPAPAIAADAKAPAPAASPRSTLASLVIDIVLPTAAYFTARKVFGLSTIDSYAIGGTIPAVRVAASWARGRSINAMAILMLVVNLAGIGLGLVAGSTRLMIAKDSGISSVFAIAILLSVWRGRPLLTAGLEPFLTKGEAVKTAAWHRLEATSEPFRAAARRVSLIWGVILLAECVARLVGAFTMPVSIMTWLSGVLTIGAIALACVVGGAATGPLERMLTDASRPA